MLRAMSVLAAAAAMLMAPALLSGGGGGDSAIFNYVWTKQFAAELARGELYPRWMPASFEGLGSPAFYFYPPFAFYVSGLLALAAPAKAAITGAATLFLLSSGVTMYLWLRAKTRYALLAAVLYMAAPYHLMDFYARGALAEFAAFIWLPLIALAVDRLETRWGPALLGMAYAALIYTHLPLAVLAGVFLIAPLLLLRPDVTPRALAGAAFGGLLALLLASPYLVPAVSLRGVIHDEVFTGPYFQPSAWSLWEITPTNAARLAAYGMLAAGWSSLALGVAGRARPWLAITVISAACSVAIVPQLWTLPVLHDVQFPWRLLAIVEFAALTAFALRPPGRVLFTVGLLLLGAGAVPMAREAADTARRPLPPHLDSLMTDAVEYLPAKFNAASLRPGSHPDLSSLRGPLVAAAPAEVEARPGGAVSMRILSPGHVIVRRANFPAWHVLGPSGEVGIGPGPLVAFEAAPGRYQLVRQTLPAERLGFALALLGVLGLALWCRPPAQLAELTRRLTPRPESSRSAPGRAGVRGRRPG